MSVLRLLLAAAALAAPLAASAREEVRKSDRREREQHRTIDGARTTVTPYLEVDQVALARLSPNDDVLTYTTIAAGADASIRGRNDQGAVSLRYERRIGESHGVRDGDTISGVARVASQVVPHTLAIEAGGLAARTRVEAGGGASLNPLADADSASKLYSLYAGPTLTGHAGDVSLRGDYRLGYTRVETPRSLLLAPGQRPLDVFDDSVVQSAALSAGVSPGLVAPLGLTVSGGWNREDISNLDQRVEDRSVRADAIYPVALDLALLAGVGYEHVEVSSRDALRDAAGNPVVGRSGRFVTDKSAPRKLAYDVDGLIYDAGVMWRPSRRTSLEAHVGRRYGSTSYFGSFAYAPDRRSSLDVSVYDAVTGLGGRLRRSLEALPADFTVVRNPLNGDITGCIAAAAGGGCLDGALASVASAAFRNRGVSVSYGHDFGRIQAGVAAGYDRRRFFAAPGTVLAVADGVVDETVWADAYLTGRIDRRSSWAANAYASFYQSGFALAGDATALGANGSYYRNLAARLWAVAAVGIDGIERDAAADQWTASALVGLRYAL